MFALKHCGVCRITAIITYNLQIVVYVFYLIWFKAGRWKEVKQIWPWTLNTKLKAHECTVWCLHLIPAAKALNCRPHRSNSKNTPTCHFAGQCDCITVCATGNTLNQQCFAAEVLSTSEALGTRGRGDGGGADRQKQRDLLNSSSFTSKPAQAFGLQWPPLPLGLCNIPES